MSKPYIPRAYQTPITNYILDHPRCGIWAGVGFGKTAAVLAALQIIEIVEPGPTLVIAPPRVARSTWKDEIAKWDEFAGISISCIIGTPDQRTLALSKNADIYTISDVNLPWLVERLKDKWPFQKVVWDEASKLRGLRASEQTSSTGKKFIRVGGSIRLRGLARLAHYKIDRFIELTATPAPNGLKNTWGGAWFLDKGVRLGRTYDSFSQRWFKLGYDGFSIEPLPHAEGEIQGKLKDICMSLLPKDWFAVKEANILPVYVDLPAKARALYRDMEKALYMEIKGRGIEAFNAGSRTMKCRQLASGAAYHDVEFTPEGKEKPREWSLVHDEKIQAIQSILDENDGMPVIVVYDFQADLARLKKAFPHGRHLDKKKDEDDFKAGKIDLLFMHFQSAGHGIDGFQYITNIMVIMSPNWDLEQLEQGIGRIGPVRQLQAGLDRPVFIYPILARDTIDEDVYERWSSKRSVQDILLQAMKTKG